MKSKSKSKKKQQGPAIAPCVDGEFGKDMFDTSPFAVLSRTVDAALLLIKDWPKWLSWMVSSYVYHEPGVVRTEMAIHRVLKSMRNRFHLVWSNTAWTGSLDRCDSSSGIYALATDRYGGCVFVSGGEWTFTSMKRVYAPAQLDWLTHVRHAPTKDVRAIAISRKTGRIVFANDHSICSVARDGVSSPQIVAADLTATPQSLCLDSDDRCFFSQDCSLYDVDSNVPGSMWFVAFDIQKHIMGFAVCDPLDLILLSVDTGIMNTVARFAHSIWITSKDGTRTKEFATPGTPDPPRQLLFALIDDILSIVCTDWCGEKLIAFDVPSFDSSKINNWRILATGFRCITSIALVDVPGVPRHLLVSDECEEAAIRSVLL